MPNKLPTHLKQSNNVVKKRVQDEHTYQWEETVIEAKCNLEAQSKIKCGDLINTAVLKKCVSDCTSRVPPEKKSESKTVTPPIIARLLPKNASRDCF